MLILPHYTSQQEIAAAAAEIQRRQLANQMRRTATRRLVLGVVGALRSPRENTVHNNRSRKGRSSIRTQQMQQLLVHTIERAPASTHVRRDWLDKVVCYSSPD